MSTSFQAKSASLRRDESGDIRVGASRVLLDMVVHAFQDGATPEAIVQNFPTLELADTYAAITYYLQNREEIEDYLQEREQRAETIRREIESHQPDMTTMRETLLSRRLERAPGDASITE